MIKKKNFYCIFDNLIQLYIKKMIRNITKTLSKFNTRQFSTKSPSETSVFFESVTSTVKGYMNPNYITEHDPTLTPEQKAAMKRFLIYKYDPENPKD